MIVTLAVREVIVTVREAVPEVVGVAPLPDAVTAPVPWNVYPVAAVIVITLPEVNAVPWSLEDCVVTALQPVPFKVVVPVRVLPLIEIV